MREHEVAEEFSADLGGRYRADGDFSGEEFREDYLLGWVDAAIRDDEQLVLNFDGVSGMPTSFLEEAFGGLVRSRPDWTIDKLERALKLEAPSSPTLWPFVEFAKTAMRRAANSK